MEQTLVKDISLAFSRKNGKFTLSIQEQSIEQNVCEFLLTVSFLVGKDLEELLLNPSSECDYVRIPLTGNGKTITLSLAEFVRFREAYANEMYLLKLEDLLCRKGIAFSKS